MKINYYVSIASSFIGLIVCIYIKDYPAIVFAAVSVILSIQLVVEQNKGVD